MHVAVYPIVQCRKVALTRSVKLSTSVQLPVTGYFKLTLPICFNTVPPLIYWLSFVLRHIGNIPNNKNDKEQIKYIEVKNLHLK